VSNDAGLVPVLSSHCSGLGGCEMDPVMLMDGEADGLLPSEDVIMGDAVKLS